MARPWHPVAWFIEEALTRVWVSSWSFGGYEEPEYYQPDHRQVGMGMLLQSIASPTPSAKVAAATWWTY
ncbi:MAG: hypothetical protein AAF799_43430 [Myxococcota bacterium]